MAQLTADEQKMLDKFAELQFQTEETVQFNYCPDCNIPMTRNNAEYQCPECRLCISMGAESTSAEATAGVMRIGSGPNKGRYYNFGGDYAKTQRATIMKQLQQLQAIWLGNEFPISVLNQTADMYNDIQRLTLAELNENNVDEIIKKFVRRGNIKDEILAAILYFECIRAKIVRKKKDIAAFMRLPTNGFSRGEDILRELHADGRIDIPIDAEPMEGFIDRYMESMGLDDERFTPFIIEICELSEAKKIGMNSQTSSKIVGCFWILINHLRLPISALQLERAADNTKKNTFAKFSKVVVERMSIFGAIFDKYGIPRSP